MNALTVFFSSWHDVKDADITVDSRITAITCNHFLRQPIRIQNHRSCPAFSKASPNPFP